jgi:hypothetical protein
MIGRYKLEVLEKTGWVTNYEGDDMGAYSSAVFAATLAGRTVRTTVVGTEGTRP